LRGTQQKNHPTSPLKPEGFGESHIIGKKSKINFLRKKEQ